MCVLGVTPRVARLHLIIRSGMGKLNTTLWDAVITNEKWFMVTSMMKSLMTDK